MVDLNPTVCNDLEKFVKSNSHQQAKLKGYQLVSQNKVKLHRHNLIKGDFHFKVQSQRDDHIYDVNMHMHGYQIRLNCSCQYDYEGLCKHLVGSITYLRQKALTGKMNAHLDQNNASFPFKDLSDHQLMEWTADHPGILTPENINLKGVKLIIRKEGITALNVKDKSTGNGKEKVYRVTFTGEKGSDMLDTFCRCDEKVSVPCSHKLRALLFLKKKYGIHALQGSFDWSAEKKQMLADYGYKPDDDFSGIIEFFFDGFSLIGKRSSELIDMEDVDALTVAVNPALITQRPEVDQEVPGIALLRDEEGGLPLLDIRFFKGNPYKNNHKIKKVNKVLSSGVTTGSFFSNIDKQYLQLFMWYQAEFRKQMIFEAHLQTNSEHEVVAGMENVALAYLLRRNLPFLRELAMKYIPRIRELFNRIIPDNVYTLKEQHTFNPITAKNLKAVEVANETIRAKIRVQQNKSNYILSVDYYLGDQIVNPVFDVIRMPWIIGLKNQNTIACWQNESSFIIAVLTAFKEESPRLFIPLNETGRFIHFINQFQQQIEIDMSQIETNEKSPDRLTFRVSLSEMGNFLLFYPLALYDGKEVFVAENPDSYYRIVDEGIEKIPRDPEQEKAFYDFLVSLHPNFSHNNMQEFFYLSAEEVMEGFWFLDFFEQCKKRGIEIIGFEKLKNIKYNPHKPFTSYSIASGIDWFDVKMEVKFGEQKVSLNEIRKSVLNQQKAVKLDDGSMGVLPEDWINKWITALKFGKLEDNDTIKLSNLHFLLIDELYNKLDDKALKKEIREKKKKLKNFQQIEQVAPPADLHASLRHYQQEGLNWLNFLYEYGWGGCLADDMGLGKTLQALALILHIKQKEQKQHHVSLVVAPRTLIFNWQTEIEKFCPQLNVKVHWGQSRDTGTADWKEYDVVLTTYGTLTNDIDFIREFSFNLAILDESQAIKNTSSLRFKAVRLLTANCRLTLTGTPIENNTLELFAQMQFLNPGYLGSFAFFKKEFSNAIDKQKSKGQAQLLAKMIRPFVLRRKKEDVAKELPEKTENLLYCEMSPQQRKVYDYFREDIRRQLLTKIEQEGLEKAKFNILEGLLKLRQICDSPALLNTKEDYGNDSVKVDEIIRHISEKTGQHKVLIFSQFVGMLNLVKEKLDHEKISYAYIDGQTRNRKEQVQTFQHTDTCRVFLLSIKAGGLGLNLTEADYVYILDPWWNPAVEAQAIDRTHRIGQEKHVFSYKMICKDTIEEKIVHLQQKKKEIADDLISTEKGFMSTLSRKDLEDLLA